VPLGSAPAAGSLAIPDAIVGQDRDAAVRVIGHGEIEESIAFEIADGQAYGNTLQAAS
jgi:hypothetical protein